MPFSLFTSIQARNELPRLGWYGDLLVSGASASGVPPVDLGPEHDHDRHHVQPDEQDRRAGKRLQYRVVLGDVDIDRQELGTSLAGRNGGRRAWDHFPPTAV